MNIVRWVYVEGWLNYDSLFMKALNVKAMYTKKKRIMLMTTVFKGSSNHSLYTIAIHKNSTK